MGNWVKGEFSPIGPASTPGVHGPCNCLGAALCLAGEQCALCGLHLEVVFLDPEVCSPILHARVGAGGGIPA